MKGPESITPQEKKPGKRDITGKGDCTEPKSDKTAGKLRLLTGKILDIWKYFNTGVWADNRRKWWIKPIRTLNLSMRSFFNANIQTQSCAMTFRTLLALVPALALLFAIGRGFGLQNLLEGELFDLFPGQKQTITGALGFVDSYLEKSSEGIFVGVGLVFLLYTVINLLSNVEDTFNIIWGVKQGRTLGRKISDYTAMLLILPVLLICAGGLSAMVSEGLQSLLKISGISEITEIFLEAGSWVMICLFFAGVYILVPNTKISVKYAFIAGLLSGTAFMILQWLFVSGQMYVARYNAIYGSFSFLPLLLIWMQFVWMVCLVGAVVCYSMQNVYTFSFTPDTAKISPSYRRKIILAVVSVVCNRFKNGEKPITIPEFVSDYEIPARTVTEAAQELIKAGVLTQAVVDEKSKIYGYVPGRPLDVLTVGYVFKALDTAGDKDIIPEFNKNFPDIDKLVDKMGSDFQKTYGSMRIIDLPFIQPESKQGQ